MRIITLDEQKFDAFAKNHRYRSYYQTSDYGNLIIKDGKKVQYIGIMDDDANFIGASLVIYEEVFMGQKYAYMPRGPLFDFTDVEQTIVFIEKLKKLLGKQGFMYVKIDPYIPLNIRDNKGVVVKPNKEGQIVIENLHKNGFTHSGYNLLFENDKSRWEAITILEDNNDIYQTLDKTTKNKIQKAIKSGISIINDDEASITKLYDFIKNKHSRSFDYYNSLITTFKDNAEVYYAVLDSEKFVINTKKLYDEALQENYLLAERMHNAVNSGESTEKHLNRKMESDKVLNSYKYSLVLATKLLKDYPNGIMIAGMITIKFDNAVYLLIEGYDDNYKHLNPNYLLKWHIIEKFSKLAYKYFNLNAITGDFTNNNPFSGLNEMKLGYNALAVEYIGQFELVINPFFYNLYMKTKK